MEGNGAIAVIHEFFNEGNGTEMAKKKADDGVSKSELVRQKFGSMGWDSGPKAVIEALKEDGVDVTYGLVSQVKSKHGAGNGKPKSKRATSAAVAPTPQADKPDTDYNGTGGSFAPASVSTVPNVINLVRQIRELAKQCGGKSGLIELINEIG